MENLMYLGNNQLYKMNKCKRKNIKNILLDTEYNQYNYYSGNIHLNIEDMLIHLCILDNWLYKQCIIRLKDSSLNYKLHK